MQVCLLLPVCPFRLITVLLGTQVVWSMEIISILPSSDDTALSQGNDNVISDTHDWPEATLVCLVLALCCSARWHFALVQYSTLTCTNRHGPHTLGPPHLLWANWVNADWWTIGSRICPALRHEMAKTCLFQLSSPRRRPAALCDDGTTSVLGHATQPECANISSRRLSLQASANRELGTELR